MDEDTRIKLVIFEYNPSTFDADSFGNYADPIPASNSTVALYTEEFDWIDRGAASDWLTLDLPENLSLPAGEYGFGLWLSNPDHGTGSVGGRLNLKGSGSNYPGGVRLRVNNGNSIQSTYELKFVLQGTAN